MDDIPTLPRKRWFESQRWLNRFDTSYTRLRRLALQDFLRKVFRIPDILEFSSAVKLFVEYERVVEHVPSIYQQIKKKTHSTDDTDLGDIYDHYIF